jgi:hypothetical protein
MFIQLNQAEVMGEVSLKTLSLLVQQKYGNFCPVYNSLNACLHTPPFAEHPFVPGAGNSVWKPRSLQSCRRDTSRRFVKGVNNYTWSRAPIPKCREGSLNKVMSVTG